eukprot:SAG11_NODE_33596_length_276_cov_0.875706_1_plen_70_part_10
MKGQYSPPHTARHIDIQPAMKEGKATKKRPSRLGNRVSRNDKKVPVVKQPKPKPIRKVGAGGRKPSSMCE